MVNRFETFERVYEERFERAYGFYRPYLRSIIYRYLDCGVLRNGFTSGNALFKLIGFLGQAIGHVQDHLAGVFHIHNATDR